MVSNVGDLLGAARSTLSHLPIILRQEDNKQFSQYYLPLG